MNLRHLLAFLAILTFVAIPSLGHAYALTSDSAVDETKWDILKDTKSYSTSGNTIVFDGSNGAGLTMISTDVFSGDFSAVLSFNNFVSHAPDVSYDHPGFRFGITTHLDGNWKQEGTIVAWRNDNSNVGHDYLTAYVPQGYDSAYTDYAEGNGEIRISRTGSTVTISYNKGSGWVDLKTYNNWYSDGVKLILDIDSGDDTGSFAVNIPILVTSGGNPTPSEDYVQMHEAGILRDVREKVGKYSFVWWKFVDGYNRPFTPDYPYTVSLVSQTSGNIPLDAYIHSPYTRIKLRGSWTEAKGRVTFKAPYSSIASSYFEANFTNSAATPHSAGDYTLMFDGNKFVTAITAQDGIDLPYVESSSINAALNSGTLQFSWTLPNGYTVSETTLNLMLELYTKDGQPAGSRIEIEMSSDKSGIELPSTINNLIEAAGGYFRTRVRLWETTGTMSTSSWVNFRMNNGSVSRTIMPQKVVVVPLM